MNRKHTREIRVGNLSIGNNAPIAIQTMWSQPFPAEHDDTAYEQLLTSLRTFATMGCSVIRFSYPSSDDKAVFSVCKEIDAGGRRHYTSMEARIEAIACGDKDRIWGRWMEV